MVQTRKEVEFRLYPNPASFKPEKEPFAEREYIREPLWIEGACCAHIHSRMRIALFTPDSPLSRVIGGVNGLLNPGGVLESWLKPADTHEVLEQWQREAVDPRRNASRIRLVTERIILSSWPFLMSATLLLSLDNGLNSQFLRMVTGNSEVSFPAPLSLALMAAIVISNISLRIKRDRGRGKAYGEMDENSKSKALSRLQEKINVEINSEREQVS